MFSEVTECTCTEMFKKDPMLSCRISQEMLGSCGPERVWCCDKHDCKYKTLFAVFDSLIFVLVYFVICINVTPNPINSSTKYPMNKLPR